MVVITTEKHDSGSLVNYQIFVDGMYFGTWFGPDEKDAIRFAERNLDNRQKRD